MRRQADVQQGRRRQAHGVPVHLLRRVPHWDAHRPALVDQSALYEAPLEGTRLMSNKDAITLSLVWFVVGFMYGGLAIALWLHL
jgi:hypothetical protein